MVFEKETNLYQDAAIRSKFTSQDTQFSVIQGKISYLITDSEIATYDDGKGTITSRMNSAENTVSEHSSTISSMRTEIDNVTGDVEEFHSTYNTFVQNTEGTFSQVSETLSTKTHVFRDQPAPPYNEGDFWIKDKDLYVCVNSKATGESYSAADWIPSTKGRVFTTTPTVPYNAGDMWMQGSTGDIKICTATRTSGSYSASDWSNASRYIGTADLTTWYDENLKDVIEGLEDGEIKTYYQPTDPSSGWTSEEKPKHQGDIWYCSNTTGNYAQKYYRWSGTIWQQMTAMPPSDVVKTISDKGTIFTSQPTTAQIYHVGDLWVNAKYPPSTGSMYNNEILRCNTAKAAGSPFSIDHWEKASKYTDDSTLTNWLTNTYATDKSSLQTQIDGKIETWSQANDPSTAWSTSELRTKHAGDMWFCSATTGNRAQKYYRWDGSQWLEVTAEPPTAMVNTINAKANIFTGSGRPAPPYKIGDLWFNATGDNTGEIYTCVVPRESGGSAAASDWRIRNKYTDDSTFTRWRTTTYNSFINQLPNEINLQVTGSETTTAGEVYTGKGDIILNINNTLQSEATISANKINLEAYSTATENEAMAKADYIGSVAPTLNNYPASTWATDTVKSAHIGETYYNKETELTYYFKGIPNNGMLITFDSNTATEPQNPTSGRIYDYFQIFFTMDGMLFESKKYCGAIGALEFFIPSNTFWIYWHTDNSGQDYYGFSFSSVATVSGRSLDPNVVSSSGLPDFEAVETNNITTIATAHNPYAANDDKLWKFTANFPVDTDKTFSWTRTEEIAPYIDAKASVIVTSEGLMSKVSAGAIASTINQTAQSVLIDASKINLQGYLTITDVGDSGSTVISGSRITTGTISADRVMGGTFKAGGSSSGTSGKNGVIEIYNSSNSRLGRIDSTGIYFGNIASNLSNPNFKVDDYGYLTCKGASLRTAADSSSCNIQLSTSKLSLYRNNTEIGYVGFDIQASSNTAYAKLYGTYGAIIGSSDAYIQCQSNGDVVLRAPVGKNVRVGYPGELTTSIPIVVGEYAFYLRISNGKLYIRNNVTSDVEYYVTLTRA